MDIKAIARFGEAGTKNNRYLTAPRRRGYKGDRLLRRWGGSAVNLIITHGARFARVYRLSQLLIVRTHRSRMNR